MISRRIKKGLLLIYHRPKGFLNYCMDLLSALIKIQKAIGLPVHITIEPTNICNLCCPVCETGSDILDRKRGNMSFDNFKNIIDKIHNFTNSIIFYYMGEPFLNKDCYRMIGYAKEKSIYMNVCTNGNIVDVAKIIDSGIDEVCFQIGGITEESHRQYRVGSTLSEVISNVRNLVGKRASLGASCPKIILGLIVMRHNEHEINGFYQLAKQLGVDEARLSEPCLRTVEQARKFLPDDERFWLYDRVAFDNGLLRPKRIPHNRCNWIYFSSVILWNGDVVPCCRDVHGKNVMGNILEDNFSDIWNGDEYRKFRKAVASRQGELELCNLCSGFNVPSLYKQDTKDIK